MANSVRRLPDFASIDPATLVSTLQGMCEELQSQIDQLVTIEKPTWLNFVEPLGESMDVLSRFWSPASHLNAVMNTEQLRDAYNNGLQVLQGFYTDLGQNQALYQQYLKLAAPQVYDTLNQEQRTVVDHAVRDFKLSGVGLEGDEKERYKAISLRQSELGSKFQDNVLDATNNWQIHLTDDTAVAGLPAHAKAMLAQSAAAKELEGWLVTLEQPTYIAVMTYADDRELRKKTYFAYNTRASDQGPGAGQWDNSAVIHEILALRAEKAKLLGFGNYAELSLETKMAESPDQVCGFLRELASKSKPMAESELAELQSFAKGQGLDDKLQAWDAGYYAEKLREQKHNFSSEELKPYFPASRAVDGLFAVTSKLFSIQIEKVEDAPTYHEDVELFRILDASGQEQGLFYLDMYARANKRSGAWMAGCVDRNRSSSETQLPIAFLTCNLTPPIGDEPALFNHDEVVTLFHEFGHGLHHMLTQVDAGAVSGINGVEWDAVELPSQFLENWCWQRESLDLIAAHYQTGELIPDDLLERAQAARNFGAGMQMIRQIEFSLFDINIHNSDAAVDVQAELDKVREEVSVMRPPAENRFQHGFLHIFAGGYGAGYFSYKWAEVLSADAFARFEEEGIFSAKAGEDFKHAVLEKGGSRPAMQSFVEFRGREPQIDALLRHNGLAA
ncbi:MAG: M3 family metallopeptidase [Granulosicoccaceae bacterium]